MTRRALAAAGAAAQTVAAQTVAAQTVAGRIAGAKTVAALTVAALAVAALAGCGGAAPPPPTAGNPYTAGSSASASSPGSAAAGSSASGSPAGGSTSGPVAAIRSACKQQYDVWQRGPGQGLVEALTAFGQTTTTAQMTVALTKAKPTLVRASRTPMPQCADPRGYWMVLVMHVNAAAASTSSKSSMKTAMKGVPAIAHDLLTELQQTAAVT